jgi:hypothetical protein
MALSSNDQRNLEVGSVLRLITEGLPGLVGVAIGVVLIVFRARLSEAGLRMNEIFAPWSNKGMKPTQAPVIVIAIALLFGGAVAIVHAFVG